MGWASVIAWGLILLRYQTDATCGVNEDLSAGSGWFTSPRYPDSKYPANCDKTWSITAAPNNVVLYEITDMNIEYSSGCIYDAILIVENNEEIRRICGEGKGVLGWSGGHSVDVTFSTDATLQYRGFNLTYAAAVDYGSACGDLTASSGVFSSPGYPGSYPEDETCTWTITVTGSALELQILELELDDYNCEDHLVISGYDYRICDGDLVNYLFTNENYLAIQFITDDYTQSGSSGFRMAYTSVTGADTTLGDHSGWISSPNYPDDYPNDDYRTWLISVSPGGLIRLHFASLFYFSGSCDYDYIIVNGGDRHCRYTAPDDILIDDNRLILEFGSNGDTPHYGFGVSYYEVADHGEECGGQLGTDNGAFTSPGYPHGYEENLMCTWIMDFILDNGIMLKFLEFDLHDDDCEDYLMVGDHKVCGDDDVGSMTLNVNNLNITFISDGSDDGEGFSLIYSAVSSTDASLGAQSGWFTSPNYPYNYPFNDYRVWIITVPTGSGIRLHFEELFEFSGGCWNDFLTVNGGDPYCGSEAPEDMFSNKNRLTMEFETNGDTPHEGFGVSYYEVFPYGPNCGFSLVAPVATFASPDYPNAYPAMATCTWTITVPNGGGLELRFTEFHLVENNCADHLMIGGSLYRVCGGDAPDSLLSNSRPLTVQFITDSSDSDDGFEIAYTSLAILHDESLGAESGWLKSSNFPDYYSDNEHRVWLITVAQPQRIRLHFLVFKVRCDGDHVTINNIDPFCGGTRPNDIVTEDNTADLTFVSDDYEERYGFYIAYYVDGQFECGATLSNGTGQISSPFYPYSYPQEIDCTWTITVPAGQLIELVVDDDPEVGCSDDYLRIYDTDGDYKMICSSGTRYWSRDNTLVLEFHSDNVDGGDTGFDITYTTVDPCVGSFITATGTFRTARHPNYYPNHVICVWDINIPGVNVISLEFNDFVVDDDGCGQDTVTIVSGDANRSVCRSEYDFTETFQTNQIQVIFDTDDTNRASGFSVTYTTHTCEPACMNGDCDMSNTCNCHDRWEGESCNITVCNPQCDNGHCGLNHQCVCDAGWTGNNCSIATTGLTMQDWAEYSSAGVAGPCYEGLAMNVLDQDPATCITIPHEKCGFVAIQFALQQSNTYRGSVFGQYLLCEEPVLTIATRGNCSTLYPYTQCVITQEMQLPNDFTTCNFTCPCDGTSDQLRIQISNRPWLAGSSDVAICGVQLE